MKRKNILPHNTLFKIIRENTSFSVSKNTSSIVEEILEDLAKKIITKANILVETKNKKTITHKEIKLAYELLTE